MAKLTNQETKIVELIQRGLSNKLIAHRLDLAEATVKVHIRNMFRKANFTNRTQLAIFYHEKSDAVAPAVPAMPAVPAVPAFISEINDYGA